MLVWCILLHNTVQGTVAGRILFLMQSGHQDTAIDYYRDYQQQLGEHDFGLLQQIGLQILEQGFRSSDAETRLLAAYGAGIAFHERTLYLLEEGLGSRYPELQLVCLNFLAKYQHVAADEALKQALSSDYLLIRLEGAFHLAKKRSFQAVAQSESLMMKVDPAILPLFPQLFAAAGTAEAMKVMRRLLTHRDEAVRIAAVHCAADYKRDDLLPSIRILMTQHMPAQQEACAYAVGVLKDEISAVKLEKMLRASSSSVRLAACQALYRLGRLNVRRIVEEFAKENDLFAIALLGEFSGSENLLVELARSPQIHVKANAAIALLKRKDSRCLPFLSEILLKDSRDLAIVTSHSPGKALTAYKIIPSAHENLKELPIGMELSLQLREEIVSEAAQLDHKSFFWLANLILAANQNDLVPVTVEALMTIQTPEAISLLKQHQQKVGAPLIRHYCNLALYKLKEPGPYAELLRSWIVSEQKKDLIQFRPIVPWNEQSSPYQLSLQETSRLLVNAFAAFTESRESDGIDVLLDAIKEGNTKNKYALAGLLIRAAQ